MVDEINGLITDPKLRENYRENLLSYTSVLADGKYKIGDYINAVKYVSYKLLGSSNIEAYSKTFPDRFQRLVQEGADDKTISSYSTAYNKNKLVNLIFEQTLVPSHILNADLYQKALNVQAQLMISAASEKVRSDAANSLLTHLKMPETTKIELDVGIKVDKSIEDLLSKFSGEQLNQYRLNESSRSDYIKKYISPDISVKSSTKIINTLNEKLL